MASEQLFVFCYDIADNRVRRKMAEMLELHGTRVQESVFEVRTSLARAEKLMAGLGRLRLAGDNVRMYCIPEDGRKRSLAAGGAPVAEASEFWLL